MPLIGAKSAPPLHGALQWTGSNQGEFISFGYSTSGSPGYATVNANGTLRFTPGAIGAGVFTVPVDGWVVGTRTGRGAFPMQVGDNLGTPVVMVFTDEEFRAQFTTFEAQCTTLEDWSTTY